MCGQLRGTVVLLLALVAGGFVHSGEPAAAAQVAVEIYIPERTVLQFTSSAGPEGARSGVSANKWRTTFDLACATLGSLPAHCLSLYGGPLLDTEGRPYPPVTNGVTGRAIPSDFPQFFESPEREVRIYTQASGWELQVELLQLEEFPAHQLAVSADPGAEWQCLGYHPSWDDRARCEIGTDAARSAVPIVRSSVNNGDWHEFALRLMLRLDGSETAGTYSGVLRYTLASF